MRKTGLLLLIIWLFVSLACNFPVVTPTPFVLPPQPTPAFQTPGPTLPPGEAAIPSSPPDMQPTGAAPLPGLATAGPGSPTPGPPPVPSPGESYTYPAQAGDTLEAIARRFGVAPELIHSSQAFPVAGLIPPGQILLIPNQIEPPPYPVPVMPDSEVVYSPTSLDFDIQEFVSASGGYLGSYSQLVDQELLSGVRVVQRVAENTSTNPRLLLAFLEYRSGWVTGSPANPDLLHPLGFQVSGYQGLFLELSLVGKLLNIGYYGWRQGTLMEIKFTDGSTARLAPHLNAGSTALQYLFARLYKQPEWQAELYGLNGLLGVYGRLFGDPWLRAARLGPLFPPGLQAPALELPFAAGEAWSLTAGPHPAWNTGTPYGALDFGPITGEPACSVSRASARAAAPGVVVRTGDGVVVLDLDGDGREQTGWVLVYVHIARQDRAAPGLQLNLDDPVGHPSCEGGAATGSHVHLARKFNGEWITISADWPLDLSGWAALPGEKPYQGTLVKGEQVVSASGAGISGSKIIR